MKRLWLAVLSLSLAVGASAAKGSKKDANALVNSTDSVSYALGINIGMSLQEQFNQLPIEKINTAAFCEALQNILNKDTANMKVKIADAGNVIMTVMQKAEQEKAQKDLAANNIWMANNKTKPGVMQTASGLQYQVISEGKGEKPKATDKVNVTYTGTLTDGTIFDSSTSPISFELNKVIPGWTEGIQLMPVGSKYKFFIPSELAYGNRAMGKIKPNSILIFDVELLGIEKAQVRSTAKFQFKSYQRTIM
ncbi:MAG: FKBP-type peptidyl-prolyl cis-trans isomerase [Paludibacteraceae bacterium]|nr:FKBP-type peptidyl-prolyl cis-trans isomerase [Paludibacteraceae bacterium]